MRSRGREESENEAAVETHVTDEALRRRAELLLRCGLLW
jgi:hypothetical protein